MLSALEASSYPQRGMGLCRHLNPGPGTCSQDSPGCVRCFSAPPTPCLVCHRAALNTGGSCSVFVSLERFPKKRLSGSCLGKNSKGRPTSPGVTTGTVTTAPLAMGCPRATSPPQSRLCLQGRTLRGKVTDLTMMGSDCITAFYTLSTFLQPPGRVVGSS